MTRLHQVLVRAAILAALVGWGGQLLAQNAGVQAAKGAQAASAKAEAPADKTGTVPASSVPAASDNSYLIGPQDVLNVQVWKEKELSGTVPVRPDGKISLPLLDDVQAAGLTAMQLSTNIAGKLKKYVEDPKVTVVVEQVNSRQVYVLGEVNRPGVFSLHPQMTVLQAIAKAGGLTPYAHKKKIQIKRADQAPQRFNYDQAIKGKSADVDLQPGDTIIVP